MASFADYVKDLMDVLPTVKGNPMLSVTSMTGDNARYMEDPFYKSRDIQARDQLALDEEERKRKEAAQSGSGMLNSGSGSEPEGRNYYQEIEDKFFNENLAMGATPESARTLAQRQAFDIQSANNTKLASGLNLFANSFMPGVGMLNTAKYGVTLPDYLQGNYRTMIGDTSGYQSPYTPKAAGIAAPVVSGQSGYNNPSIQAMIANDILSRQAENEAMTQAYRDIGGFKNDSTYISSYGTSTPTHGSMSNDTARGLTAARETYGYGSDANYYGD